MRRGGFAGKYGVVAGLAKGVLAFSFALHAFASGKDAGEERASIILVVGAGGEQEYTDEFARWAADWENAADRAGARLISVGLNATADSDLEQVRKALEAEPPESAAELWLVMLGHGTADAKGPKLNLRRDDLSAEQLGEWLKPFRRPVVLISAFSSSGAFLKPLAAPSRVVVTATRSGSEHNYSRFGRFFSRAIGNVAADLDKDDQVSVLEAYLTASKEVAEFYKSEGRLATEHALLDDNGDGLGTPADWFRGVRAVKRARDDAQLDGLRAHQIHLIRNPAERALSAEVRAERDALERDLAKLREGKATMPEEAYYRALESILLKIASLYENQPAKED